MAPNNLDEGGNIEQNQKSNAGFGIALKTY